MSIVVCDLQRRSILETLVVHCMMVSSKCCTGLTSALSSRLSSRLRHHMLLLLVQLRNIVQVITSQCIACNHNTCCLASHLSFCLCPSAIFIHCVTVAKCVITAFSPPRSTIIPVSCTKCSGVDIRCGQFWWGFKNRYDV